MGGMSGGDLAEADGSPNRKENAPAEHLPRVRDEIELVRVRQCRVHLPARTCPRCLSATGAPATALGGGLADARATRCTSRGQGANSMSRTGTPPRSLAMRLFERGAKLPRGSSPQGFLLLRHGLEKLVQGLEKLCQ
jgi:hypothetical protein